MRCLRKDKKLHIHTDIKGNCGDVGSVNWCRGREPCEELEHSQSLGQESGTKRPSTFGLLCDSVCCSELTSPLLLLHDFSEEELLQLVQYPLTDRRYF